MNRSLLIPSLVLAVLCTTFATAQAAPEEPWERQWRTAEKEQDELLKDATSRRTTRQLVGRYASRLSRQPSALNHFLLGRALYYDKDVAGAERQLLSTLRLQPTFWPARLRLGVLALERKRPKDAEQHVTQVLRRRPQEPDALRLMAQIRMDARDWDRALQVLDALLLLEPTNLAVRRNISSVLMAKEDWKRAVEELRILRGRAPRDPAVRYYYATALFKLGELKEAAHEFEGLLRIEPKDLGALDMLRVIYTRLKDWKSLLKTLERMHPLVPDEDLKEQIEGMIEELRKGAPEQGQDPEAPPETWPADSWMALVERCMEPTDPAIRRQALQAYFAAEFPRIPHVLVSRLHWKREPDPLCRSWILRIVGSMQNPELAQVTAYALYDPDAQVRSIAAETLGELATPSGVLYLLPVLLGLQLAEPPTDESVAELNAARHALLVLSGRRDTAGGTETWIEGASLPAIRKDWMEWLESPEGVHLRLRGIEDLEVQGDEYPERVLVEDVLDPNVEIARAAYGVLLRRSKRPSTDPVPAKMWPEFPRFGPDDLKPEGMGRVRQAVQAWRTQWRELEKATAAATDGQ